MRERELSGARRLLAIAAGLVAFYLVLLAGQRAIDGYRARQEVAVVKRDIEDLRARNVVLRAELEQGQRDLEIERVARTDLGLARPGEHPVILIGPKPAAGPQSSEPSAPSKVEPNWRRWLRLFFDTE